MLKIAHISDLHFSHITYSPLQFFSKRWLGNFNLLLSRKRSHNEKQVDDIVEVLKKEQVDCVFITGDLSTTSKVEEFNKANKFVNKIRKLGIKTIILPGNHDHYTKTAYRKQVFYDHFTNSDFPFLFQDKATSLKDEGVEAVLLNKDWCCVSLDTVIATSLLLSTGLFSERIEKSLISVLENIPPGIRTMLICHYPFFCNDSFRKRLVRKKALKKILEKYNVSMYLHGHTHNQTIANLMPELPLILDSGSCSRVKEGFFHIMELQKDSMDLFVYEHIKKTWVNNRKESFSFESPR